MLGNASSSVAASAHSVPVVREPREKSGISEGSRIAL